MFSFMKAVSYLGLTLIFIATTASLSAGTPQLILYCTGTGLQSPKYNYAVPVTYVIAVDLDRGSVHVRAKQSGISDEFDGSGVSINDGEIKFHHPESEFTAAGSYAIDRYSGKFEATLMMTPNGKEGSGRFLQNESGTCTSNPEKKF